MKLGAALSLAIMFVPAAAAQKTSHQYLVRFHSNARFPAQLRSSGVIPLHHDGQVWAVQASDEKVLRQTTEIQSIIPATSVMIELEPGVAPITGAITDAGGIVTRSYQSISALAAIVPTSKIGDVERLLGVKRVNKSRSYKAFTAPRE
jgi:hypothetical protein